MVLPGVPPPTSTASTSSPPTSSLPALLFVIPRRSGESVVAVAVVVACPFVCLSAAQRRNLRLPLPLFLPALLSFRSAADESAVAFPSQSDILVNDAAPSNTTSTSTSWPAVPRLSSASQANLPQSRRPPHRLRRNPQCPRHHQSSPLLEHFNFLSAMPRRRPQRFTETAVIVLPVPGADSCCCTCPSDRSPGFPDSSSMADC